jgi:hypothetical protein
MAEPHLNSNELALELTKLTLQYHTASNTSWVTLASDPEKWGAYVRDVYDKCLKGLKTSPQPLGAFPAALIQSL